jgi:hypothetical protein
LFKRTLRIGLAEPFSNHPPLLTERPTPSQNTLVAKISVACTPAAGCIWTPTKKRRNIQIGPDMRASSVAENPRPIIPIRLVHFQIRQVDKPGYRPAEDNPMMASVVKRAVAYVDLRRRSPSEINRVPEPIGRDILQPIVPIPTEVKEVERRPSGFADNKQVPDMAKVARELEYVLVPKGRREVARPSARANQAHEATRKSHLVA